MNSTFTQLLKGIALILEFLGHGNCDNEPEILTGKDKGNLIFELNILGTYTLNRISKTKTFLTQERILHVHQAENTFLKCLHRAMLTPGLHLNAQSSVAQSSSAKPPVSQ